MSSVESFTQHAERWLEEPPFSFDSVDVHCHLQDKIYPKYSDNPFKHIASHKRYIGKQFHLNATSDLDLHFLH